MAASLLQQKGFETFVPVYRVQRSWATSRRIVELPLFSCYIFCNLDVSRCGPVISTHGVIGIVGAGHVPIPVQEEELAAIRGVVASGRIVRPCDYLRSGELVEIVSGPLAGTEGILVCAKNERRLIVSVTLLQRSIAVELDSDCVRPVSRRLAHPATRIPA